MSDQVHITDAEYEQLAKIITAVETEVIDASRMHPPFLSAHEGFAVLMEEFEELKTEVFKRRSQRSPEKLSKEAIQVAAMAVRFVLDVVDNGKWQKDGLHETET